MGAELERLIREALPAGAEMTIVSSHTAPPAHFPADSRPLQIAAQAIERATGAPVAFVRSGGAIPFVADLSEKGIPTIVTGFVLPDDPFHAPNESFSVRGVELGYKSARELLAGLAELKS
jgi:acetylornithine deacetylase/succinyl-diaminopimelate desuccinylase-like protein